MRVIVAGDFSPHDRVTALLRASRFEEVFGRVRPLVLAADYSIVNFESCVESPQGRKIRKLGPHLCCPASSVDALKYAGFDCVSLANNHFRDFGDAAVRVSLDNFARVGLDTVGGGMNISEASATLYRKVAGRTLAVISCCEREFSIADNAHAGSNPLDPPVQAEAIAAARQNADNVIVIVHGGSEYFRHPTPRMVREYRSFIDAGADAVINHHQHCFCGWELYGDRPIFYGLGNFCFDWPSERDGDWNRGYMVSLDLDADKVSFNLLPYIQCSTAANVVPIPFEGAFEKEISCLCAEISDPQALQRHFDDLVRERRHIYRKALRPSLFFRGKKALKLENFSVCPSHADILNAVKKD